MTGGVACIFGASGGVGRAMVEQVAASGAYDPVIACSRTPPSFLPGATDQIAFDLTDEASIAAAAAAIATKGPVDLVVVATGLLHRTDGIAPEKSLSAIDPAVMAQLFAINSIGPALIAKHMLPLMARDRRAVMAMLSARVGSIGDNRLGGWHSYRASKAALNMLVRTIAIEAARRNPQAIIAALHPGTVDTGLSQPFRRSVTEGQLFSPQQSAAHLLRVIEGLTPADSGCLFAWNGQPIGF